MVLIQAIVSLWLSRISYLDSRVCVKKYLSIYFMLNRSLTLLSTSYYCLCLVYRESIDCDSELKYFADGAE